MTSVLLEPVASIVDASLSTSKKEIISSSSLPSDSEAINLLMGLLGSSTSKAPVSRKRRSDVGSSGVMVEGGHSQSAMNKSLRTEIEHSSPNHHHRQQQQHDTQTQQQHVTSPSAASTTTTISVASNATLASRRSSLSTQRLNGESDVSTNSSPLGSSIHSFDDLTDLDHVSPNASVLLPPPSTIVSSVVVPLPAPDSTSSAAVVVAPMKSQPTKRRKKATSSSADSVTHASSFTSVAAKAQIGTVVNSATPTSRPAKTTPTKRPPALALPVAHTHAQSIVPMNAPPSSASSYSSYPHLALPPISPDSNATRHATIAHNIYRHQHEAHVVSDVELAPVTVHGNGVHPIVSPLHPSLSVDLTELAPSASSSPAILPSQMAPSSLTHPSTHASISAFRPAELPMETLALPLATSIPAHFQHEPMQLTQLIQQQQQPQPQQLQQQLDPYYQQQLEQQLHHQHQQQQLQLQLHHEEQIYQQQLYHHQQQQQHHQQHHPQFQSPSMFSSPPNPNPSVQYYSPSHSLPTPSSISQPAQEHFQPQQIYSYQSQHAHPQSINYYPTEHPSHPIDLQSQFNANLQLQHQQSLPSPSYGYY